MKSENGSQTAVIRGFQQLFQLIVVALLATACGGMEMGLEGGASEEQQFVGRQDRGRDPGSFERSDRGHYGTYVPPGEQDEGSNPGDGPDGRGRSPDPEDQLPPWVYKLNYSDAIITPDGGALLGSVPLPGPGKGFLSPGLMLVAREFDTGKMHWFPDLIDTRRINFSPNGKTAWVLRDGGQGVTGIDLKTWKMGKSHYLKEQFNVLDVTPDGKFLVLSNLPLESVAKASYDGECFPPPGSGIYNRCRVGFVRISDGKHWTHTTPVGLRDIDFDAVSGEVLLTWSVWGTLEPTASIRFYDPAAAAKMLSSGMKGQVNFPNCADELVLVPNSRRALLSPNTCLNPDPPEPLPAAPGTMEQAQFDPISVIDLDKRAFIKNLPGFGPVTVTPDGKRAVGFTRRAAMINDWDYHQQVSPRGLIVVTLTDLSWKVIDYGDATPTYTLAPDGEFVYVYDGMQSNLWGSGWNTSGIMRLRLSDLQTKAIGGGANGIDRFLWTTDGKQMWFIRKGDLYLLVHGATSALPIWLMTDVPPLNLRPQQDLLVLGQDFAPIWLLLDPKVPDKVKSLQLSVQSDGPKAQLQSVDGWTTLVLHTTMLPWLTCTDSASPGPDIDAVGLFRAATPGLAPALIGVVRPGSAEFVPGWQGYCKPKMPHELAEFVTGPAAVTATDGAWLGLGSGTVSVQFGACSKPGASIYECDGEGVKLSVRPGDVIEVFEGDDGTNMTPLLSPFEDNAKSTAIETLSAALRWQPTDKDNKVDLGKRTTGSLLFEVP